MSIELQIRTAVFKEILLRSVQATLNATCIDPIGDGFVDHMNVSATDYIVVETVNQAVRLTIPVGVFFVNRANVLAAPNAMPMGAATPTASIKLIAELKIEEQNGDQLALTLNMLEPDLGGLEVLVGAAEAARAKVAIQTLLQATAFRLRLDNIVVSLGLEKPASFAVVEAGPNIAIRLDPVGPAVDRTLGSQIWGLFIDSKSIEQLIARRIRGGSLSLTPHWRPRGAVPPLDIDFVGSGPLPDPFAGHGDVLGSLSCDLSVAQTPDPILRTSVDWRVTDVNLYTNPGFLGQTAEPVLRPLLIAMAESQFNPARFGGRATGNRSFFFDNSLPPLVLSGTRLRYVDALASTDGMTIGGNVSLLAAPSFETVEPHLSGFLDFVKIVQCSKAGFGGGRGPLKAVDARTSASVDMDKGGMICPNIESLAPNGWTAPFVVIDGTTLKIEVSALQSIAVTDSIRMIVQTPRGVRLIDFGKPPRAEIDQAGNVTNVRVVYLKDCLYVPADFLDFRVDIFKPGGQPGFDDGPPIPVPGDRPWPTYLSGLLNLSIQVMTLEGLEPGELVRFQSADHFMTITANADGRAIVPAFVGIHAGLFGQSPQLSLIRMNGKSLTGHVTTNAAVFDRRAILPPGRVTGFATSTSVAAVKTVFENHASEHEVGTLGVARFEAAPLRSHAPDAIVGAKQFGNEPNPLMAQDCFIRAANSIPGITSILPVPGFPEMPVAIARTKDRGTLILDSGKDGTVRVAGSIIGPVGTIVTQDDWAIDDSTGRAIMFSVSRSTYGDRRNCECSYDKQKCTRC